MKSKEDAVLTARVDYRTLASIARVLDEEYEYRCGSMADIVRSGMEILKEKLKRKYPEKTFVSREKARAYLEDLGIRDQKKNKRKIATEKMGRSLDDEALELLETEEERIEYKRATKQLENFKVKDESKK